MTTDDLIDRAKQGDLEAVQRILREQPALAGAAAESGETPLIAALYRGHAHVAEAIAVGIEASGGRLDPFAAAALGRTESLARALPAHPIDSTAYDGWTALHLAAFFGRAETVDRLVSAGANLNALSANSLRNTPLHAAIAGGHVEIALALIDRGADVRVGDAAGHTPMHIAAEAGSEAVVTALLKQGADPHAVDSEDQTPLSRAAARNHTSIVDAINLHPRQP